jgi:hypothetical protein
MDSEGKLSGNLTIRDGLQNLWHLAEFGGLCKIRMDKPKQDLHWGQIKSKRIWINLGCYTEAATQVEMKSPTEKLIKQ